MAKSHVEEFSLSITDHDHTQGEVSAPVTVVQYGDFECPYSREARKPQVAGSIPVAGSP